MAETAGVEAVPSPADVAHPRRTWMPAVVLWGFGLAAGIIALSVDPHLIAPDLLIGAVNASGVQYLGYLATVALLTAALFATTFWFGSGQASACRRATASILALGVSLVLLLLVYPAFLLGALVFSSDYRTIGTVDGRELIVKRGIGLGEFPIAVGLRSGLSVDFSSTGDTSTEDNIALDAMRFHIEDNGVTVTVTYRPGPRRSQSVGVLTVSK